MLTCLALLMPAFALVYAPPPLTGRLRRIHDAPLPRRLPIRLHPQLRLQA